MKKFLITSFAVVAVVAVVMGGSDKIPAMIVNAATASGNNTASSNNTNNNTNKNTNNNNSTASNNNTNNNTNNNNNNTASGNNTNNNNNNNTASGNNTVLLNKINTVVAYGGKVTKSISNDGKKVKLEAVPDQGYSFYGWYENGVWIFGNKSYSFDYTGARTVEAKFTSNVRVTAVSDRSNAGKVIGSNTYAKGTTVTLKAVATDKDYKFRAWYENGSIISTDPVIMFSANNDRYLIADFSAVNANDPADRIANVSEVFGDVPASAYYTAGVQFVYNNGIMSGKTNTSFDPNAKLTRAEFCRVMWNSDGKPTMQYENLFRDVKNITDPKKGWYVQPIMWMVKYGFASGYGEEAGYSQRRFAVTDGLTRDHVLQMLYSYASYKGYSLTKNDSAIDRYSDKGKIESYALDAVRWALSQGLLSGTGWDGYEFKPFENVTRGECAIILKNFFEKVAR